MGCAVTLFPLIGRLADLVRRVRMRSDRHNSPATISKALEIRTAIEQWIPPIEVNKSESLNPNVSDSIQTAEAYRWAALLTIRQSVPELPTSRSMTELGQKGLVFLATIPHMSRKTIVQVFPLLVAGCEALHEDRDWVRERWNFMAKRMIAGLIDRCKEITEEVWRRRDAHTLEHPLRSDTESTIISPASFHAGPKDISFQCKCCIETRNGSAEADFPSSIATNKNIDPLTMSGCTRYTVKGDLHWLGVMREWDWESKCFCSAQLWSSLCGCADMNLILVMLG